MEVFDQLFFVVDSASIKGEGGGDLWAFHCLAFGFRGFLFVLPPVAAAGKFAILPFAADGGLSGFHRREKEGEAGFEVGGC